MDKSALQRRTRAADRGGEDTPVWRKSSDRGRGWGQTLRVPFPFRHTAVLAIACAMLCYAVGELLLSLDSVQARLATPGLGSRHRQFEVQIGRLERLVKTQGPVDCILLGNSMVWLDLNPQTVGEAYARSTGRSLRCFNFGVSALPASSAGAVASILVERYQPRLLIYGTFARDYAVPGDADDALAVTETPWVKQQLGQPTVAGWFYSHSGLYRYRSRLRELLDLDFESALAPEYGPPEYLAYGFDPKFDARVDVNELPDLTEPLESGILGLLYDYDVKAENLSGLRRIAAESRGDVQVIVLEMPFHGNARRYFANGELDYQAYLDRVEASLFPSGTPFWRVAEMPAIPDEGWWDYFHMNRLGAETFSTWLGERLAAEAAAGQLSMAQID